MSDAPPSLAGELVEGRYRIDQVVGSGGFGTVYTAWHLLLDTRVALKVLSTPSSWSAEQRSSRIAMFLDEARTLAKLKHPNVIAALDAGILSSPRLSGPTPFLVMAWCGGGSMSELFDRGPLPVDQVAALMGTVVDAIAYAHGQGVVHRDLKPSNVMFEGVPGAVVPRVIDFGIAKLVMPEEAAGDGETMTVSSSRMFTPAYAAPEQVAGAKTGPWTDVHALGLMIVHALVGRAPYGSESRMAAIDPDRPTPKTFGMDVGPLEPILARALSLKPADRFRDARELGEALSQVWPRPASLAAPLRIDVPSSAPVRLAPAPGYTSVTGAPASMTIGTGVTPPAAPVPPTVRTPRTGRRVLIAGGLAAGAALGLAGALALAGTFESKTSSKDEDDDDSPRTKSKKAPANAPASKRKLRDLTTAELLERVKKAGFRVKNQQEYETGGKVLEVLFGDQEIVQTSIRLLPFSGSEPDRLRDLGRFLIDTRRQVSPFQAYVFDGEWMLGLFSTEKKVLSSFESLIENLSFTVRGDTVGGGDPAADAANAVIAPWDAKSLAALKSAELESRLRGAGVQIVNGPFGDAGPLPLSFALRLGNDTGDITLHRSSGPAALAERKRTTKPFAFAVAGDSLLVLEGNGRFTSPDLLAQILKGLEAKIQAEPPL
ncbi:MAG: serine/threonine protein kinase [Polyangiaceae bacterium]|nr:serine/threonine protein kinase [Polyangiaceae bacterium]